MTRTELPSQTLHEPPAPLYRLSRHALERLLERSRRAPAWLLDVLETRQFAYLEPSQPSRRRYALAFDALENAYFVAVLGKDDFNVITVLTAAQYENKMEPIRPVFYQLAQMAREEVVKTPACPASSGPDLVGMFGPLDAASANQPWQVWLMFSCGQKKLLERQYSLSPSVRSSWLLDEVLALQEAGTHFLFPMDLTRQARLIAQTKKFQAWLVRTSRHTRENLRYLTSVYIQPPAQHVARVDVTDALVRHLEHP